MMCGKEVVEPGTGTGQGGGFRDAMRCDAFGCEVVRLCRLHALITVITARARQMQEYNTETFILTLNSVAAFLIVTLKSPAHPRLWGGPLSCHFWGCVVLFSFLLSPFSFLLSPFSFLLSPFFFLLSELL
jgi:hypothetical protein